MKFAEATSLQQYLSQRRREAKEQNKSSELGAFAPGEKSDSGGLVDGNLRGLRENLDIVVQRKMQSGRRTPARTGETKEVAEKYEHDS